MIIPLHVEYFTYDPTGAYAPLEPVFGGDVTCIEGTNSDAGVYGTVIDNWLIIRIMYQSLLKLKYIVQQEYLLL